MYTHVFVLDLARAMGRDGLAHHIDFCLLDRSFGIFTFSSQDAL
jgi:hypothetical protein